MVDNSYVNVKTFAAFAQPKGSSDQIVRYFACKNPNCDRFSCVASTMECSNYCCPGCANRTGHTDKCNDGIQVMRDNLIPDAPIIMSEDLYPKQQGVA